MAAQGHNEGFHVLDDFVCDAIHAPSFPLANPANQGRNDGMSVNEGLLFEMGRLSSSEAAEEQGRDKPQCSATPENIIKSEAERLAALISTMADPIGAAALFQKRLFAELAGIQGAAALDQNQSDGRRSEPQGERRA